MDENRFWITLWSVAAAGIVLIVLIMTIHFRAQNKLVADLVYGGMSATEASCLFDDDMGNNPVCVINAMKSHE